MRTVVGVAWSTRPVEWWCPRIATCHCQSTGGVYGRVSAALPLKGGAPGAAGARSGEAGAARSTMLWRWNPRGSTLVRATTGWRGSAGEPAVARDIPRATPEPGGSGDWPRMCTPGGGSTCANRPSPCARVVSVSIDTVQCNAPRGLQGGRQIGQRPALRRCVSDRERGQCTVCLSL